MHRGWQAGGLGRAGAQGYGTDALQGIE